MKTRKNILPFIGTMMALLCCLCACQMENKADEATPRLNVEKVIVRLQRNGLQTDANKATVLIVANKGYKIESDARWLQVDRPQGSGYTQVEITATYNDSDAERVGQLLVSSDNLSHTITVYQSTEEPATEETPKTLYEETFDWAIPFAKENSDPVAAKQGNSNRTKVSDATIAGVWASAGLENWNKERDCLSLYHSYLHFNADNNFDSGVILPAVRTDKSVHAELSFVACPDGRGPDRVPLVVEIVSGAGSLSNDAATTLLSSTMIPETPWAWSSFKVKLYHIDSSTRIAIRSMGNGESKYCRWFLDNIHIKTVTNNQ